MQFKKILKDCFRFCSVQAVNKKGSANNGLRFTFRITFLQCSMLGTSAGITLTKDAKTFNAYEIQIDLLHLISDFTKF